MAHVMLLATPYTVSLSSFGSHVGLRRNNYDPLLHYDSCSCSTSGLRSSRTKIHIGREDIDSVLPRLLPTYVRIQTYIFVDSNISCLKSQSSSMSLRGLHPPSPFPLRAFAP